MTKRLPVIIAVYLAIEFDLGSETALASTVTKTTNEEMILAAMHGGFHGEGDIFNRRSSIFRINNINVEITAAKTRNLTSIKDFYVVETFDTMRVKIIIVSLYVIPLNTEPQYAVYFAASLLNVVPNIAIGHVARIGPRKTIR